MQKLRMVQLCRDIYSAEMEGIGHGRACPGEPLSSSNDSARNRRKRNFLCLPPSIYASRIYAYSYPCIRV